MFCPYIQRSLAQVSNNDGRRSNHTTTFTTGNGNTIHITRTVIGGDGSVRREMRFRTPAAPSNAEPNLRPTARVQPTSRPPPPNNTSNRYTFTLLFVCLFACSEGTEAIENFGTILQ